MYKENELYKPDFDKSSGWIFSPNGRRLYPAIGAWAKEYCAIHPGCYYRDGRAIAAEVAARDVELLLRRADDFSVIEVPQDVTRMLEELQRDERGPDEYTLPEDNANRARVIVPNQQPEWYGIKRAERRREWDYTRIINATGQNHYFNCRELIQKGVYECKHVDCKCPCHSRLSDPRGECWTRSHYGKTHNDARYQNHDGCPCSCH